MAEYQITNEKITITVWSKGAELRSLRHCKTNTEYLWDANPVYWGRTSPLLFPFIGGCKDKKYRHEGKEYEIEKHGFAKNLEFEVTQQADTEIWFSVKADDETRQLYPFDFLLEVGYKLEDKKVLAMWRVSNLEDKEMYFAIGGHPAVRCPLNLTQKRSDCSLLFNCKEKLVNTLIGPDGLAALETVEIPLNNGMLTVADDLFDHDALVLENSQVTEISFLDEDKQAYAKVSFDTPVVGIWSPAKTDAPFVCIEPWYGICDRTDFKGQLSERKWNNYIAPKETFARQYSIEIL